MRLDSVKVLEIPITKNSKKEVLEFLQKRLVNGPGKGPKSPQNTGFITTVVTPNPEQIVYAKKDRHFAEILNRADVALPDGIGVVWASRILTSPGVSETFTGIDCMEELAGLASDQHVPIALIGSWGGLAVKAFDRLQKKYPGLAGWAEDGPDVSVVGQSLRFVLPDGHPENPSHAGSEAASTTAQQQYFEGVVRRIAEGKIGVVFVGMGAPKQEYFIEMLTLYMKRHASALILMSVGGSFDEIGGKVLRAPEWVSKVGVKWLWRLVLEPWRMYRQVSLLTFIWLVIREKFA